MLRVHDVSGGGGEYKLKLLSGWKHASLVSLPSIGGLFIIFLAYPFSNVVQTDIHMVGPPPNFILLDGSVKEKQCLKGMLNPGFPRSDRTLCSLHCI